MILNKKAAEFGVITGLCSIAYSTISYFVGMEYMISWTSIIISLLLFLTLDIVLTLRLKKLPLESITYGQAFAGVIIYMGVAGLLNTVFGVILFKVIDTDLPLKTHDASVQFTMNFMQSMGAPQEKIDEAIDNMKFNPDDYTYIKMLIGYLTRYIYYAIFALIMAIFIKRSPPLFDARPLDQTISN